MTTSHKTTSSVLPGSIYVGIYAVIIPLMHLSAGLILDRVAGNPLNRGTVGLLIAGALLFLTGLAVMVMAIVLLHRFGEGLPLSSSPPRRLVSSGPYRWSRHPIYLGGTLAFTGFSLLIGSFWSAVLAGPLLGYFYFTYGAGIEEPVLLSRFGEDYRTYQSGTPLVTRFPLRRTLVGFASTILQKLSALINRPWIVQKGNHIFFFGYGIWPALGTILGLIALEFLLLSQGIPAEKTGWVVAAVTAASLLGSRVLWRAGVAVIERIGFRDTSERIGFVSWGIVVALLIILPITAILLGESPCLLLDATFPALMITHFFGRTGCVFYGCCYGKETSTPLRFNYLHPALKAVREGLIDAGRVRPVQVLSALNGLLIAALVFGVWYYRSLPAGAPVAMVITLYGFLRTGEEWLRTQKVTLWGIVSPYQLFALALLTAGLTKLLLLSPEIHDYTALREILLTPIISGIHPAVIVAAGVITGFTLSYHHGKIGLWK